MKKVYFHKNKIWLHIYKKPTANSHGKFSEQIASKFLRHILAANSHGKLLRQIRTANSQLCKTENGVE